MLNAPAQRRLPLTLVLPVSAALVTVETARTALGIDEDSVVGLVDSGGLSRAWDISAAAPCGPTRIREMRIWAACIAAHQAGKPQPADELAAVIDQVLPPLGRASLRSDELQAILCCGQQTVQRLHERGHITGHFAGRTRWLDRHSVVDFLTRRIIA